MTPRTRNLILLPLIAGAYFLCGKLGLRLAFVQANATAVWAPTGLAIAAVLLLGLRVWPAIFVGAFLVNLTTAGTVWTSLGIAAGNTLEAVVGGWLVQRFASGPRAFDRASDVFRFTGLAAVLATTVSATIGVTVLSLGGFSPWREFLRVWFTWWLGDASGALVVTPLLVTWLRAPAPDVRRAREGILLIGLMIVAATLIFRGMLRQLPVSYAALPPLLLLAFRMGPRGAAIGVLALASVALWGTLTGRGPFARPDANESLLLLQAFHATAALTAYVLAAVVAERSTALQAARKGEEENALLYRDAQRSIAARDEFLSVASHELKTPLTSLLLNLDGLLRLARKKGIELHPEAEAMVEGARKQVLELGTLINSMLDFTRIRAGKLQIDRVEMDLAEVAREVATQLEPEFVRTRSALTLELAPIRGRWDRLRMSQVITNLLTNALKYGRNGPVRLSAGPGGPGARIAVQDRGIGMTAEQIERVFHPFERAVTSRHYEGLGLGLYIIRQIVEAHGGSVRVESQAEVGSTFTVDLPLE